MGYPLVNVCITMEYHHSFTGKLAISVAIFNGYVSYYQRVQFVEQSCSLRTPFQASLRIPSKTWLEHLRKIWRCRTITQMRTYGAGIFTYIETL